MINLLEIFNTLATEENGSLTINGKSKSLEKEAKAQESIYLLKIPYKDTTIQIQYAVGAQHVAEVSTSLEAFDHVPEFEISTRSPLLTYIFGDKNRVKLKCKDPEISQIVGKHLTFSRLKSLSAETNFEPFTYSKNTPIFYTIRTEYHLRFPERTQELKPLINFYKKLIDDLG